MVPVDPIAPMYEALLEIVARHIRAVEREAHWYDALGRIDEAHDVITEFETLLESRESDTYRSEAEDLRRRVRESKDKILADDFADEGYRAELSRRSSSLK